MATKYETVKAGKDYERAIAKAVGGRRLPRLFYGDSVHDVEVFLKDGRRLLCECKLRKAFSIARFMEQAEGYAVAAGDVAALFLREKGKRIDDTLVVLRLPDALAFLGLPPDADAQTLCETCINGRFSDFATPTADTISPFVCDKDGTRALVPAGGNCPDYDEGDGE